MSVLGSSHQTIMNRLLSIRHYPFDIICFPLITNTNDNVRIQFLISPSLETPKTLTLKVFINCQMATSAKIHDLNPVKRT